MNALALGAADHTDFFLSRLEFPALIIDHGPLIDAIKPPKKHLAFDVGKHSFDILEGMNEDRACAFVEALFSIRGAGETTLATEGAELLILDALVKRPRNLASLVTPQKNDLASQVADRRMRRLLYSPRIRNVLTRKPNCDFDQTVIVRLDRRKMPAYDARILSHLLIMLYRHQVVITDFGFIGRDYLAHLIADDRLMCGVRSLEQLPDELRQEVLLIKDKEGRGCTAEDAAELASYMGISRIMHSYAETIKELTS